MSAVTDAVWPGGGVVSVRFVGRRNELLRFGQRLSDLSAGRGGVGLIVGEPGIGKSALVEQFGARAVAAGTPLLVGRAAADEGVPSFWPWHRALSGPAAAACGLSANMLRWTAAADGPAAAARFGAVVRASEGLLSAAKASGLVVILEDLHWADDATLQLLRYLGGAELSACPLLIVGTSRDPVPDGLAGLTGAWIQRLEPLTVAEVAQYLGQGVHPSWPVAVHRRSAGNPLFVSELSRLLAPADMTEPTDGAWKVPTDLVQLISARLNQLPDRCRGLLDGASAAGEVFDLGVLDADDRAVTEAVAAGVLIEDRSSAHRFRWSHAVVRDAWYDRLPRDDRLRWHRRIADELQRRGVEQVFEVAAHRLRSAVDEQSRCAAVQACQSAAAVATRTLDFTAAAHWHAQALPLLGDDTARARTLLALGRAAYHAGLLTEALQHCQNAADLAETLGDVDLLVEAAVVVRGVGGVPLESVIALCERARAALGDEESARHARVLAQHASLLADALNIHAAGPLSERAMAMAERSGDPDALLGAIHARHEVIGGLDGVGERLALGARQLQLAATGDRPDAALVGSPVADRRAPAARRGRRAAGGTVRPRGPGQEDRLAAGQLAPAAGPGDQGGADRPVRRGRPARAQRPRRRGPDPGLRGAGAIGPRPARAVHPDRALPPLPSGPCPGPPPAPNGCPCPTPPTAGTSCRPGTSTRPRSCTRGSARSWPPCRSMPGGCRR